MERSCLVGDVPTDLGLGIFGSPAQTLSLNEERSSALLPWTRVCRAARAAGLGGASIGHPQVPSPIGGRFGAAPVAKMDRRR